MNKVVPKIEQYEAPKNIKEELEEDIEEKEHEMTPIVLTVNVACKFSVSPSKGITFVFSILKFNDESFSKAAINSEIDTYFPVAIKDKSYNPDTPKKYKRRIRRRHRRKRT